MHSIPAQMKYYIWHFSSLQWNLTSVLFVLLFFFEGVFFFSKALSKHMHIHELILQSFSLI